MGNRGEININNDVFLYSHWGGDDESLLTVLQDALSRRQRWEDPSYLARIIFSTMIKDDIDGETGYGISGKSFGENSVTIKTRNQMVYTGEDEYTFDQVVMGAWRNNLKKDEDQEDE